MKKFQFGLHQVVDYRGHVDIEAETLEEAEKKLEEMDSQGSLEAYTEFDDSSLIEKSLWDVKES